ncbi:MAG TPA: ribonuclease III [Candidatus Binatia bacterium]|nr:ribonuclease III [Candidatus Binatia bacterium]
MSSAEETLEERIGHAFRRPELLALALVHRSAHARAGQNNEKLEFLGDAVLDLAISDRLMERFPTADEGELSKRRAALVNARVLAAKAAAMNLGAELRLGKGEEKSGGRRKASILAAAFEAVIGAVYLDGGFDAARALVSHHFREDLVRAGGESPIDHKSRLQEITQRLFRETPTYTLVRASGPDHDRAFLVEIFIAGRLSGRGEGKSKKEAEQHAALEALAEIETRGSGKGAR